MRKKRPPADKNTLFCSFCGDSQHEVRKLVAGPTVFICDKCISICDEIITDEASGIEPIAGHKSFFVRVDYSGPTSEFDMKLLPSLAEAVNEKISTDFPGSSVALISAKPNYGGETIRFSVSAPEKYKQPTLEAQVRELTIKLKIEQQRYLLERDNCERLQAELNKLKLDLFGTVIERIKKEERERQLEKISALTLFFDVVGFSRMGDEDRGKLLDFLRSISNLVFRDSEVHINMWGDGIIVVCRDINAGLRCGCNLIDHLGVSGFNVRASANWGIVRFAYNEALNKRDVDGESINLGARIEPLAEAGELLATEMVYHNPELTKGDFFLHPKTKALAKGAGDKVVGEEITVYSVRVRNNLSAVT